MSPEREEAWKLYWRGLGPRPIPVDMEAVKRVAEQINAMPKG